MIEKILPQEQVEKLELKESSRLRNQPNYKTFNQTTKLQNRRFVKNYKTFIRQSKILKKIEFQKQL